MKLRAVVVDDEPLARSRLTRLLEQLGVNVIAEGRDGVEAIELVRRNDVNILFIDIQMPNKNGLIAVRELSDLVDKIPAIVFCTAHDEYALEAFRTSAIAYLLKPVVASDIQAAIIKAKRVTAAQLLSLRVAEKNVSTLTIHHQGITQKAPLDGFSYFYSVNKNVYARLMTGEEIYIDQTLKSLEQSFPNELIRVHRSTLVNREHVFKLVKNEAGAVHLELTSGGNKLTVSRRHLSEVKKCFDMG